MLKRDRICEKCGCVSEFIYEIRKTKHYYCSNCHNQQYSHPIELNFTNKNISKARNIDGTGDLVLPSV